MKKNFALTLCALLLAGICASAQEKTVKVTVRATFPDLDGDMFTEVPSHQLKLLIGDENSNSAATGLQVPLDEVQPGVFTANVNLGNYKVEDMRYVGWGTPWKNVPEPVFVFVTDGHICVRANVPTNSKKLMPRQIQKKNGVLDRFYMYAPIELVQQPDSSYVANNVQLRHACAYALLNVYGKARKMDKEEVLQTVSLIRYSKEEAEEDGLAKAGNHINAQPFINPATGRIWNYTNGRTHETVLLQEPCTIAERKKTDGVKVYMCTYANGGSGKRAQAVSFIKTITVETNKAVYTKELDKFEYRRSVGEVTTFDLDLATFKRKSKD